MNKKQYDKVKVKFITSDERHDLLQTKNARNQKLKSWK